MLSISPLKDVDGLHPINFGYLLQGRPNFIPCTPYGCIKILDYYKGLGADHFSVSSLCFNPFRFGWFYFNYLIDKSP